MKKQIKHKATLPMFDFRAGFVPETWNEEKRTVDVTFATDTPYLRQPWFDEPYYEVLQMKTEAIRWQRLQNGAPLLNNHASRTLTDVMGVVETAKIENGVGVATVRLSKRPELAGLIEDIKGGIIRNVSVGYMVHKFERQSPPDGAEGEIPTYIATDWEPMELSFVGIPADANAQARGDSAPMVRSGELTSECILETKTKEEKTVMGKRNADGTVVEETEIPAATSTETPAQAEVAAATTEGDAASSPAASAEGERGAKATTQTPEEIQTLELQRGQEIRKSVRAAGLDEKLADGYVAQKLTVEQARAAIFGELEKKTNEVRTNNNLRVEGAGMEQSIARREAATRILLNQFNPTAFKLKDGDNEMRAHGLLGMARKLLAMEGVKGAYEMSPREISERALHTTSDFPLLLANLANKSLMAGWEQAPSTYEAFTREISVSNFKDISSVRLSAGGPLQKVNEHGEFKRGSLVEAGGKYSVDTFGLIIGATRKLLMNDDLNAFTSIPQDLGMRAKQTENNMFWSLLLSNPVMDEDGQPLFSAAHGNISAAAGAPSIATLSEGRSKLRLMLDLDKQPINQTASYLVVPTALETTADQLTVPLIAPNLVGSINPFANKLQPLAEPRLDAASATTWYLFSDKTKGPMVELARIDGQGPKITVREGFDIDGMETKISYDFGMKFVDYRGFFRNQAP